MTARRYTGACPACGAINEHNGQEWVRQCGCSCAARAEATLKARQAALQDGTRPRAGQEMTSHPPAGARPDAIYGLQKREDDADPEHAAAVEATRARLAGAGWIPRTDKPARPMTGRQAQEVNAKRAYYERVNGLR